jgi:hypothetical protein
MAKTRSSVLTLFLMVFALATSANAGITTYSGFDLGANAPGVNSNTAAASFDAAAPGDSIITFESAPLGPFASLTAAPGVTITGTDYYGSNQTIRNSTGCTNALCGNNTTSGGSQFLYVFGGTATFTFASPVTSFGAYFGGLQVDGINISFTDAGGPETVSLGPVDYNNGGFSFVGFTDTSAFSSVTVNAINDFISVDDVRYGATSQVPEPSTLLLLGSGLAGLVGLAWRKN